MSKGQTKYFYEEAFKQRRINYCTIFFVLIKIALFILVLAMAVLEGSILKRKLVHSNEKSLHHAGTFVDSNGSLMDSNDFVHQTRHKSNFKLFTDVRLFQKQKETIVSEHCISEKICLRVQGCSELKCLKVKETLEEEDPENLRLPDQTKQEMLKKFMFYVRPRTDYIFSEVAPGEEQELVFFPSPQFNVFTLQSILEEFVATFKNNSNDQLAQQNWQNAQRIQEILGQIQIPENPSKISNPLNRISLR